MSVVTMLRKVPLFAYLPDRELEQLAGCLVRRTFGRGMIIFHKGSPARSLYIVRSGRVRIFLLSEFGQEMSLNVYGPREVFGELALLDGQPRSAGAMVMERTEAYTLHRDDFLWFLKTYPPLAEGVIQALASGWRYTTEAMERLAFLDAPGRVAAKLLELADRYGVEKEGIEINFPLTQAEMASWVVARRESVNKVMGTFRDQALIAVEGQRITILDREGLARWIDR